jgi:hypothetical protein
MRHVWERREVQTRVVVGRPEGKSLLRRPRVCERKILKWISKKDGGGGMNWIYVA